MMPSESLNPVGRFFVRAGLCLLSAVVFSAPFPPAAAAETAFSFEQLCEKARTLADSPFAPPESEVPEFLRSLTRDQWRDARYVLEKNAVWQGEKGRLDIEPLLPGFVLNQTAVINIVDENGVRTLPFSPEALQAGDRGLAEKFSRLAPGFAGFRLIPRAAVDDGQALGVMCASHFQFSAKNARLGVFARPLLLDIATDAGESYSMLREYWIHTPDPDSPSLTVHALMDSPMMTGAYEFVVSPGTSAVLDVRAVFHRRRGAASPAKIGVSSLTGMFLFSETEKNASDYRPEVHSCDGLFFTRQDGDWQWIPLKNPERLTVSDFPCDSPKGFGLIQRDGNFDHYQDLANRFDRCSSVWIEPKGDWGAGKLELMEIPGSKDFHSNIMAYWVPDASAPGANDDDDGARPPPPLSYEYRMYWTPPGVRMHELGVVRDTRMERPDGDGTVVFHIDFDSAALNALPADTGLTSVVELPEEVALVEKRLVKNDVAGGWRLSLRLLPPQSGVLDGLLTARDGPPRLWASAFLKRGENLPEPLTETWRYRVMP